AAFAARRAAPGERASLAELNGRMVATGRSGDLEGFLRLDVEFHRRILEMSGNEMFAGLTGVVSEVLAGRTEYDLMPSPPRPEALRLHTHVAEAISGGLADVARAAMRAIVDEVVAALEDETAGDA
ncbi:FadR/GntR family transcriptional regulator, partial [Streptomonospora algeriensis]